MTARVIVGGQGYTRQRNGTWVQGMLEVDAAFTPFLDRIRELEAQLSALVARETQRESGKNFLRGVAAPEVYRG